MDGWMFCTLVVIAVVFSSAPSLFPSLPSLLSSFLPVLVCFCGKNGMLLAHLKVRKLCLVWPSRSAFERTFPPRKWSRNGVVTRGHHCCYPIVVFCNARCAEQLRSWSREDLVADEQEIEGNWRWGRNKGHERKPHRHRHTDREEEKKIMSVWMLWQWWWVYPFVVPPQFLSLSLCAAPVARSLRLWMMIALELENPRIQPTRLKQSQCLDLKGGLPLSFSHIPFWDIPIHLWEWMSTSGWSLKKKKKKKSRKRVNLSLFGNSRKEEQTREEVLGSGKKKGKWRRPCSGPPSTGNSSTHDRDQNWFDLNSSACDNKRGRNPSQWQHQRVWRSQLLLLLPVAPARRKRVALHLPELAQVTLMHQYYYPWRSCMTWRSGKTKNLTIAPPVIMTTTR